MSCTSRPTALNLNLRRMFNKTLQKASKLLSVEFSFSRLNWILVEKVKKRLYLELFSVQFKTKEASLVIKFQKKWDLTMGRKRALGVV